MDHKELRKLCKSPVTFTFVTFATFIEVIPKLLDEIDELENEVHEHDQARADQVSTVSMQYEELILLRQQIDELKKKLEGHVETFEPDKLWNGETGENKP